jgi:hypothetical protein
MYCSFKPKVASQNQTYAKADLNNFKFYLQKNYMTFCNCQCLVTVDVL